ncbi:Hypothetical Protein AKJ09_01732 [Labilithrix luteola]|uniref:Uncharacterized protein n=1 Tax=Labilithrix luteola TaxID=1391654 RepID=A0A0K1PNG4_9BACT|nr:DUF4369 domain-containing protein [Labilithrix luteola]AKU95068.1 Hypothetical Protein AKJ09_01732 [Labilithrix luteola]
MATIVVAACGSNEPESSEALDASTTSVDASTDPPAPPTFSVGGTVKGLLGTGLVLQNNLGDDIPIAKDGSFSFGQKLTAGAKFSVSIKAQPTAPSQSCTVSGESGTIASGNVTTVLVNCTTDKFSLGGTVSGVVGAGLVLQNNGADALILGANGTFAFPKPIASGSPYAITVKTQPASPTQTCTVTNGTGTMGDAKVTNVAIACTTNSYSISGTVSGLAGTGLVLQSAGGTSCRSPRTARSPSRPPSRAAPPTPSRSRPSRRTRCKCAPSRAARARSSPATSRASR